MTLDKMLTKERYDELVALTQKRDELKEDFVERVEEIFDYMIRSEMTQGRATINETYFKPDRVNITYEQVYPSCTLEPQYTNFPSDWLYQGNWKELCDEAKKQEKEVAKRIEEEKRKKREEEAEKRQHDLYEKLKETYESHSPAPTE